jgi:hypothetical protein
MTECLRPWLPLSSIAPPPLLNKEIRGPAGKLGGGTGLGLGKQKIGIRAFIPPPESHPLSCLCGHCLPGSSTTMGISRLRILASLNIARLLLGLCAELRIISPRRHDYPSTHYLCADGSRCVRSSANTATTDPSAGTPSASSSSKCSPVFLHTTKIRFNSILFAIVQQAL